MWRCQVLGIAVLLVMVALYMGWNIRRIRRGDPWVFST
jgi:hypothetical protein